ncbi:MAG: DNA photolyase [Gammaproteobacteria bacterium]|nr:DNA photolyase [Gammaproteobacteria bacterium]
MQPNHNYQKKFERIAIQTPFVSLDHQQQTVIRDMAHHFRFTLQELRQVSEIALDLNMWGEPGPGAEWRNRSGDIPDRIDKRELLERINDRWRQLKAAPNYYPQLPPQSPQPLTARVVTRDKQRLGLGQCPVASEKTRCCNLLTLDAVENCGYHCSYCSIQSFRDGHAVYFDTSFADKLRSLKLDPNRTYHIGTGQSSDSLMWGNSHGVLDALIDFAKSNPNVILELKTKSGNVGHLLRHDLPANLICTWSLNPQRLIAHEERASASLDKRLDAALQIADAGSLVGFHFHPMIHYQGWQQDYGKLFSRLQQLFMPDQVVMVSFGTLTFTKTVVRKIRESSVKSQILKLELIEADGKLSYSDEIKHALFSFAYNSFQETWKQSVFFYLCMENPRFWVPVFGYDYPSNPAFEKAMHGNYLRKIARSAARTNR